MKPRRRRQLRSSEGGRGEISSPTPSLIVKVRAVIKMLRKDGWTFKSQRGSHRQFEHPVKPGKVTVAGNLGDEMKAGTLAEILRQSGLKGRGR